MSTTSYQRHYNSRKRSKLTWGESRRPVDFTLLDVLGDTVKVYFDQQPVPEISELQTVLDGLKTKEQGKAEGDIAQTFESNEPNEESIDGNPQLPAGDNIENAVDNVGTSANKPTPRDRDSFITKEKADNFFEALRRNFDVEYSRVILIFVDTIQRFQRGHIDHLGLASIVHSLFADFPDLVNLFYEMASPSADNEGSGSKPIGGDDGKESEDMEPTDSSSVGNKSSGKDQTVACDVTSPLSSGPSTDNPKSNRHASNITDSNGSSSSSSSSSSSVPASRYLGNSSATSKMSAVGSGSGTVAGSSAYASGIGTERESSETKIYLSKIKSCMSASTYSTFLDAMVDLRTTYRNRQFLQLGVKVNIIKALIPSSRPDLHQEFEKFFPVTAASRAVRGDFIQSSSSSLATLASRSQPAQPQPSIYALGGAMNLNVNNINKKARTARDNIDREGSFDGSWPLASDPADSVLRNEGSLRSAAAASTIADRPELPMAIAQLPKPHQAALLGTPSLPSLTMGVTVGGVHPDKGAGVAGGAEELARNNQAQQHLQHIQHLQFIEQQQQRRQQQQQLSASQLQQQMLLQQLAMAQRQVQSTPQREQNLGLQHQLQMHLQQQLYYQQLRQLAAGQEAAASTGTGLGSRSVSSLIAANNSSSTSAPDDALQPSTVLQPQGPPSVSVSAAELKYLELLIGQLGGLAALGLGLGPAGPNPNPSLDALVSALAAGGNPAATQSLIQLGLNRAATPHSSTQSGSALFGPGMSVGATEGPVGFTKAAPFDPSEYTKAGTSYAALGLGLALSSNDKRAAAAAAGDHPKPKRKRITKSHSSIDTASQHASGALLLSGDTSSTGNKAKSADGANTKKRPKNALMPPVSKVLASSRELLVSDSHLLAAMSQIAQPHHAVLHHHQTPPLGPQQVPQHNVAAFTNHELQTMLQPAIAVSAWRHPLPDPGVGNESDMNKSVSIPSGRDGCTDVWNDLLVPGLPYLKKGEAAPSSAELSTVSTAVSGNSTGLSGGLSAGLSANVTGLSANSASPTTSATGLLATTTSTSATDSSSSNAGRATMPTDVRSGCQASLSPSRSNDGHASGAPHSPSSGGRADKHHSTSGDGQGVVDRVTSSPPARVALPEDGTQVVTMDSVSTETDYVQVANTEHSDNS